MTSSEPTPRKKSVLGLFPELLGVGGIQEAGRITVSAMEAILPQRGWSFDLLGLNDPVGEQFLIAGGSSIPVRGFARAKAKFVLSGIELVRKSSRRDVRILIAAHPNLALPAVWMRGFSPRLKTIVFAHGVEVWKPLPAFRRRALLKADVVIVPSSDTANKLVEIQGVSPEKIRKLAWPLNPAFLRLAESPEKLPRPAGFPQGKVILTVGRWAAAERYKGVDDLISAIAQMRDLGQDAHLVAVGEGDDLPRLRQRAAQLNVESRVYLFEMMSRADLAACYAHADVFALPSSGEGFGLVFLEAMAFGKPVVAAAAGGPMDIVEDGANGFLVPPKDVAAIALSLGRLLADDDLRIEMGRRALQTVHKKYRFEVFRESFEHILTECGLDQ